MLLFNINIFINLEDADDDGWWVVGWGGWEYWPHDVAASLSTPQSTPTHHQQKGGREGGEGAGVGAGGGGVGAGGRVKRRRRPMRGQNGTPSFMRTNSTRALMASIDPTNSSH